MICEREAAEDDGEDEGEQEDEESESDEQPPDPPVAGPLVSRQRRVAARDWFGGTRGLRRRAL